MELTKLSKEELLNRFEASSRQLQHVIHDSQQKGEAEILRHHLRAELLRRLSGSGAAPTRDAVQWLIDMGYGVNGRFDLNVKREWHGYEIKEILELFALGFPESGRTDPGSGAAVSASPNEDYFWPDGSLKWGHPIDVGHLILQLQTLDPKMKVSSVMHINMADGTRARAFGLSMSRERWDKAGWLNWKLEGPECLAIWAHAREPIEGLNPTDSASPGLRPVCPKCGSPRVTVWYGANLDANPESMSGECREDKCEFSETFSERSQSQFFPASLNGEKRAPEPSTPQKSRRLTRKEGKAARRREKRAVLAAMPYRDASEWAEGMVTVKELFIGPIRCNEWQVVFCGYEFPAGKDKAVVDRHADDLRRALRRKLRYYGAQEKRALCAVFGQRQKEGREILRPESVAATTQGTPEGTE